MDPQTDVPETSTLSVRSVSRPNAGREKASDSFRRAVAAPQEDAPSSEGSAPVISLEENSKSVNKLNLPN